MYCIDFEYDNQRLSDYGCRVCCISKEPGFNTISMGSNITFNTINRSLQNKFTIMSTQYAEAYTATFEIGKFNCENPNDYIFTQEEISRLMRWLNKRKYAKFKIIYEHDEYGNVYYMGAFNAQMIVLGGDIIGLELTLQTNAPFGYYEPVECKMSLGGGATYSLYDISDESGFIYPSDVKITCRGSGNLVITNSRDGERKTVINNCSSGEVITLDGENKIITSNRDHKKLYNDFNYNFIRISNLYEKGIDDAQNTFSSTLPCDITFSYSPICKIGIV